MPGETVLVTGAGGFIGKHVCSALEDGGHELRRAHRRPGPPAASGAVRVGDIGPASDWAAALEGVRTVVHLAAPPGASESRGGAGLEQLRLVTVEGTRQLARCAAAAGVRRLVYASSVKVNGESTGSRPFSEQDQPNPRGAYGLSKKEAEEALAAVSNETGLEVVIVRPPLVYGEGAGGNFRRLWRLVERGVPLPLAGVQNRRSLVGARNLASLLVRCVDHPGAAGQTFLVCDEETLSTPDLIRRLARASGRKERLYPFPPGLLRLIGTLTGKAAVIRRLCDSLEVDGSKAKRVLGWSPPYSLDEELAAALGSAAR